MKLKLKNRTFLFIGISVMIFAAAYSFVDISSQDLWLRYVYISSIFLLLALQVFIGVDFIYPFTINENGEEFIVKKRFKYYKIPKDTLEIRKSSKLQPGIILRAEKFKHALPYSLYGEDKLIGLVSYIGMCRK